MEEKKLFNIWHEFKKQKINRDELIRQFKPIRKRIGELLEQGSYTDPALKASRFCRNLLENFTSLWTFIYIKNIEPNNHAERCIRPAVTWRKKYFGTRSNYGSEFVARSMSVRMTCQLQGKNTFQFICQALQSYFAKTNPPSLVLA